MRATADGGSSVQVGERFDPVHDPYLADPYPLLHGGTGDHARLPQSRSRLLGGTHGRMGVVRLSHSC